jgi:hypothetical protein
LIPGTFDLMDLGSYICALILFFTINQFLKWNLNFYFHRLLSLYLA